MMVDAALFAKMISTAGMAIEAAGFFVLTAGVWSANSNQAEWLKKFIAQSSRGSISVDSLIVSDDVGHPAIRLNGGFPSALSQMLPEMEKGVKEDRCRLIVGVCLTGLGLCGQILGTWAQ